MNKLAYKIVAWILIVSGIIYAAINLYFSFGGQTVADNLYELGTGLLLSALIIMLSFFPGKYYLAIGDSGFEHSKLTKSSLILTIIGMLLVVVAFFAMIIMCPPPSFCYGWGLMIVFYGIFPAAVLYAIAIFLLLLNKIRK
jgi:hypothetical protein